MGREFLFRLSFPRVLLVFCLKKTSLQTSSACWLFEFVSKFSLMTFVIVGSS